MSKRIVIYLFLLVSSLSGCSGILIYTPYDCPKISTPNIDQKTLREWYRDNNQPDNSGEDRICTKSEFLKDWGKPDSIESTADNSETWTYKRGRWCGTLLGVGILVPLMLPSCDGYEYIEFVGEEAQNIRSRSLEQCGFLTVGNAGLLYGCKPLCDHPYFPLDCGDSIELEKNALHLGRDLK